MKLSSVVLLGMALSLGMAHAYGSSRSLVSSPSQDDTWSVIEYPEGREVMLEFKPGVSMSEAKATARVMRTENETTVNLEVSGATGAESAHQVYLVDSLGNATLLGTLTIADGAGNLSAKTALSKFMIVVSPEADLTAIAPDTKISLRSVVPEGFAVVPKEVKTEMASVEPGTSNVEVEQADPPSPEYDVPSLDVGSLRRGNSKMKVKLSSGFEDAKGTVVVSPQKNGPTQIRIRITNLKEAPEGTQYILWQVGPNNSYTPLGYLTPTARKRESLINAETSASEFGLLITFENADANRPAGSMVATVMR